MKAAFVCFYGLYENVCVGDITALFSQINRLTWKWGEISNFVWKISPFLSENVKKTTVYEKTTLRPYIS